MGSVAASASSAARIRPASRRACRSVAALTAIGALAASAAAWSLTQGEVAPACTAPVLDTGRALNLADYKGQVVYLDFWASWCGPCRESFPFMNELQRDLAGEGLQIVAVSVDKTADDARRFLARYPAQFTTVLDTSGACPAAYRLKAMPSAYLIGRDGTLRATLVGFHDRDKTELRQRLLDALSEGR